MNVLESVTEVQIESVLLAKDFKEYVKEAWAHIESNPLVWNWHLEALCEHLQAVSEGRDVDDLLINIPPGTGKSLVVSVFWPTWEWTRRPEGKWFFASYDATLSTRDSIKCRNLILSRWYQARWGHVFKLAGDQNLKTQFENDKGGYRFSTSTGGHGTGEHPDRIVVDDPHNAKKAESDTERVAVTTWWDQTMSTRGVALRPKRVIVMQRLHELDLSGHVLKDGTWDHLCIPMRYEPTDTKGTKLGFKDPRTKVGELLTPGMLSEEVVAKIEKALGSRGTAGQLQQRPSPKGGGRIKRHWFRYWKVLPHAFDMVIQSWDATFDEGEESDYVVGQVWGRLGAEFYLIDQIREQMNAPDTMSAIRNLTQQYPMAVLKLLENKANGPAIRSILSRSVPGIVPITPKASKTARLEAVSPTIEAGNVLLPDPDLKPWVGAYIEELCTFPTAPNDDQVDCTSQALLHLIPAAQGVVNKAHQEANEAPAGNTADLRRAQLKAMMTPNRKKPRVIDPFAR